jgi:hypothetical protein
MSASPTALYPIAHADQWQVGPATIRAAPEGMTVTIDGASRLARTASEREDVWVWCMGRIPVSHRLAVRESINAAWAVHVVACMSEVETSVERAAETRRIERPALESRPIPDGWEVAANGAHTHYSGVGWHPALDSIDEVEQLGHDILALARWRRHEERVAAQKRDPAGDAAASRARQGSRSVVTPSGTAAPAELPFGGEEWR